MGLAVAILRNYCLLVRPKIRIEVCNSKALPLFMTVDWHFSIGYVQVLLVRLGK